MSRRTLPLGGKIALFTAVPLLAVTIIGSYILQSRLETESQHNQRLVAETILEQISAQIRFDLELEDADRIQSTLTAVGAYTAELTAVQVDGPSGTLATLTRSAKDGQATPLTSITQVEHTVYGNAGKIGKITVWCHADRMRLGSSRLMRDTVLMMTLAIITVIATCILLGVGIGSRFAALKSIVNSLRSGNLRARAPEGRDELGQLGATLNRMAETIQERDTQVSQMRELEIERRAAEAATRAKSDFLANMSHEIRTPMTAILGYAENLMDPSLDTELRQTAIDTIWHNGHHLLEIINNILDISKIEAGKLQIEHRQFSVAQIMADVVALMQVRAKGNHLELSASCETPIPLTIASDPLRLKQILLNLVGNAIKFTEAGKVEVIARLLPADGSIEPQLEIDVVDTGIGMSEEHTARLFQPFVQADETMARRFGGTGLGLSISQRLAEAIGGSVSAQSSLGQGSKFTLRIPIGSVDGTATVETIAHGADCPARTSPSIMGQRELDGHILLVEDGPDNQRLITFILKKAGAEVSVAENGQVAIELALASRACGMPFDAILMDMQMPVMDGYVATRKLREYDWAGPIIAITAHAMSSDRNKCIDAGCDDFTTKPVNRRELIDILGHQLGCGAATQNRGQ